MKPSAQTRPNDGSLPARALLVAAPILLLASTSIAFRFFAGAFGPRLGYLSGFLFYWLGWCLLFPLAVIGPKALLGLFASPRPRFGRPAWAGLLLLGIPVIAAYATKFPQVIGRANPAVLVLSALIALVNAAAEETLWRGLYIRVFGEDLLGGWILPAVGFGVWHFAPQLVYPNTMPGGALSLVVFAAVLGLGWGWVARKSGTIRWTVAAHFLLNFAGLGALIYLG